MIESINMTANDFTERIAKLIENREKEHVAAVEELNSRIDTLEAENRLLADQLRLESEVRFEVVLLATSRSELSVVEVPSCDAESLCHGAGHLCHGEQLMFAAPQSCACIQLQHCFEC